MSTITFHLTEWDGTAIGTLALAVATFALAWQNRAVVRAAQAEVAAAREDLAEVRKQSAISQAALETQTAPFITSVPIGAFQELVKPVLLGQRPGARDAGIVEARLIREADLGVTGARMSVPVRNVGSGLAIFRAVTFVLSGGTGFAGAAISPALGHGDRTRLELSLAGNSPWLAEAESVLASPTGNFSVIVAFADAAGHDRGATRLDVYKAGTSWRVTQAHFADDADDAQHNPSISSVSLR